MSTAARAPDAEDGSPDRQNGSPTSDPAAPDLVGSGAAASGRREHRWRAGHVIGVIVGWLLLLVAAFGLYVRLPDWQSQNLIVAASVAWMLALFAVPALLVLLLARAWLSTAIAALLVAGVVAVYAPLFVATTAPRDGTTLRVLTQNVYLGQADAAAIVARVEAERIDVLALQELTPEMRDRLRAAGLDRVLPSSWARPNGGADGSGIWARTPLTDPRSYEPFGKATLSAVVTPAGGRPVTIVCVHPAAPYPQPPSGWYLETGQIRKILLEQQQSTGPVIVAGDFNATWDSARFRSLLTAGYRDGAEQAGAGVVRSWPGDRSFPAVIGIDHVLTRDAVATSVRTVDGRGSDHHGLLATVVVPSA